LKPDLFVAFYYVPSVVPDYGPHTQDVIPDTLSDTHGPGDFLANAYSVAFAMPCLLWSDILSCQRLACAHFGRLAMSNTFAFYLFGD
jgi:hypothetical protein